MTDKEEENEADNVATIQQQLDHQEQQQSNITSQTEDEYTAKHVCVICKQLFIQ